MCPWESGTVARRFLHNDGDHSAFLNLLATVKAKSLVEVLGVGLMLNHSHPVVWLATGWQATIAAALGLGSTNAWLCLQELQIRELRHDVKPYLIIRLWRAGWLGD